MRHRGEAVEHVLPHQRSCLALARQAHAAIPERQQLDEPGQARKRVAREFDAKPRRALCGQPAEVGAGRLAREPPRQRAGRWPPPVAGMRRTLRYWPSPWLRVVTAGSSWSARCTMRRSRGLIGLKLTTLPVAFTFSARRFAICSSASRRRGRSHLGPQRRPHARLATAEAEQTAGCVRQNLDLDTIALDLERPQGLRNRLIDALTLAFDRSHATQLLRLPTAGSGTAARWS